MRAVSYCRIFPFFTGRAFVHPLMIRQVSIPYCSNETTRDQSCISNLNGDFEKYTCSFLENIFRSFVLISLLCNSAFTNMHMIKRCASRNINKINYVKSNIRYSSINLKFATFIREIIRTKYFGIAETHFLNNLS